MKKSGDERFEKELLQALRGPVRAAERNAARARVAQRLKASLSHLEVGAASALPLLLEAPSAAAAHSSASAAASTQLAGASTQLTGASTQLAGASTGLGGAVAAGGMGAGSVGAAALATHPLGALLTAFALGAGAGGGALAALSFGDVLERGPKTVVQVPLAPVSAAPRVRSTRVPAYAFEAPSALSSPEPAPAEPSAPPASAVTSPPRAGANSAERIDRGPNAAVSGSGAPEPDTLTAQQGLLDRARASLARGDGAQALAALSEHARVHPGSELAEEREALTIKSLLAAGDQAGARRRAAGFAARYPRSLFLPSIRAALPENP